MFESLKVQRSPQDANVPASVHEARLVERLQQKIQEYPDELKAMKQDLKEAQVRLAKVQREEHAARCQSKLNYASDCLRSLTILQFSLPSASDVEYFQEGKQLRMEAYVDFIRAMRLHLEDPSNPANPEPELPK